MRATGISRARGYVSMAQRSETDKGEKRPVCRMGDDDDGEMERREKDVHYCPGLAAHGRVVARLGSCSRSPGERHQRGPRAGAAEEVAGAIPASLGAGGGKGGTEWSSRRSNKVLGL
jgi:hypothetical protein